MQSPQKPLNVSLGMVALGLTLSVGVLLRVIQLTRALPMQLDPDTYGYLEIAKRILSGSWDFREPGQGMLFTREPFYPILLAFSLRALSWVPDYVVVRATSAIISVPAIVLTYVLSKRLYDSTVAACASLLVASNAILIILSSRGLREELVTSLLLGFLIFVVELNTRKGATRPEMNLILPASILSLLLIATRGEMLIVTIATAALLFVSSADRRLRFRVTAPTAIVIASTAGLVLNAFVAYSAHVDPWGASKATASWLYWYEFSRDHSTTYIQQGIWISPYEYLFGHHTVEQVLLFGITGVRFLLPRMNALFAPYPIWHSAGFVDLLIFIDRYLYQTFPLLLTFPGMAYMAVAGLIYAMSRQNTRLVVLPLLVPAAAYCVVYGVLPWASDLVRYVCPFLPIVFIATIALPVEVIRVRCKGPLAPRDSFYRLRPFSSYVAAIILVTIVLLI